MLSILALILALLPLRPAPDNEQPDSLVRLMNAQSAQLLKDIDGTSYRKVVGPASFLHNNTYLICDTAIWNVDDKIINAFGNVQIIQNETVLSSDKLDYLIDENLAQFRGPVVQLQDKEGNTLRTRHLDYNTKDSVAIFERGAAFRDKDGQIIESRDGLYEAKIKTFIFAHNVNMFTDSVFVKAPELKYHSSDGMAYFYSGVDAWRDDNMLSANEGYYSSPDSTFFFTRNVHAQSKDQEAWADSLYIYRTTNNILMLGEAQIKDTTRNLEAVAGYIFYEDSLSQITMKKDAAIAAVTKEKEKLDTVYVGANNVVYRTIRKCDINIAEISAATMRLKDMDVDAVSEYRHKAAENKAKENKDEDGEENQQQTIAQLDSVAVELSPIERRRVRLAEKQAKKEARKIKKSASVPPADSLSLSDTLSPPAVTTDTLSTIIEPEIPASTPDTMQVIDNEVIDTLSVSDSSDIIPALLDSAQVLTDSLTPPLDTTKIGFLFASGSVRAYRKDLQMRCDSLAYSDLDSIARLYIKPIIWNDGNRQYTSDSLSLLIKDSKMNRANLTSNAFVIIQEDTIHYDQIRASEILAYFDGNGGLARFDALGGASAVFYIEENDALATANKVESKMLSALLDSNQVQKVFYFDNPKNNAFPTMQLPKEDKKMKGFSWDPDNRPKSRLDITTLNIRESERKSYDKRPKADFRYTNDYFPGYIAGIYREIEIRDSLKTIIQPEPESLQDSVKTPEDSLLTKEKLVPATSDTLTDKKPVRVETQVDSVKVKVDSSLAPRDKWEERALKRMERQKQRDAKWEKKDARDAEKAAIKRDKEIEKQRARTRHLLAIQQKQAAKDQKRLDRYIKQFEKKKAKRPQPQTESVDSE